YYQDMRFLSRFELLIASHRPLLLNSSVNHTTAIFAVDLMNTDLNEDGRVIAPSGDIHIFRGKLLWERECFEQIRITNFGHREIALALGIVVAADYFDIFEVRGMERGRNGMCYPPEISEQAVVLP